ncbi:MAG: shikimate dehydrogenase [Corynebacterium sp.]|nr:shikimate dehydrogenase [Corynebacterium sp.]
MDTETITRRALVIGSPIAHSLSPVLHTAGYRAAGLTGWEYSRAEVTAEEVAGFIDSLDVSYRGISVTMPDKFAALASASEATDRARAIGSANTLVRIGDTAQWYADNTDTDGIRGALNELGAADIAGGRAVIVGGGGTARPALWVLGSLGVTHITVINRTNKLDEWQRIADAEVEWCDLAATDAELSALTRGARVLISTVPSAVIAGRETALAQAPVLDVIYHPRPTPLTQAARAAGHRAVEGHIMLAHQAYSQFEQFCGHPAPRDAMLAALVQAL